MKTENSSQSSLTSLTDFLSLSKEPKLAAILQSKQKIIGSCDVEKFNAVNKCQARILLITDLAVYNVIRSENLLKSMMSKLVTFNNKYSIKRRIPFESIEAITLSNQPKNLQFVLHVLHQHDYRLKFQDYKTRINILKIICKQYEKISGNQLAFYFTNDITLEKKWRQRGQNKKKRYFDGKPVYLNFQDLVDYEPGVNFELLYSHIGSDIPICSFKSMSLLKFIEGYKYYSYTKKEMSFSLIEKHFQNKHQFIALPHYVYKTSSTLYLLKPLYIGGRMDKFIQKNGPVYKELFTFYIVQLILALEFLHNRGWVYASLSLNNIYIKENGFIKIEGITANMRLKKHTTEKFYGLTGVRNNLAPQMILCEGYDEKIDIWQLGICAYLISTGEHPFASTNQKEIIKNILYSDVPFNPLLPKFIYQMLQKDPKKRINFSELKSDEWFKDIDWKKIEKQERQAVYIPEKDSVKDWEGKIPSIVYLDNI